MRLRTEALSMQELDGEAVLLDTRTSRYLSVNAVGTVVLRGLARDVDRSQLLHDVLDTFDVPRERAESDLDVFLQQLSDAGLLEGEL